MRSQAVAQISAKIILLEIFDQSKPTYLIQFSHAKIKAEGKKLYIIRLTS